MIFLFVSKFLVRDLNLLNVRDERKLDFLGIKKNMKNKNTVLCVTFQMNKIGFMIVWVKQRKTIKGTSSVKKKKTPAKSLFTI